jgi:hypothetical protein
VPYQYYRFHTFIFTVFNGHTSPDKVILAGATSARAGSKGFNDLNNHCYLCLRITLNMAVSSVAVHCF